MNNAEAIRILKKMDEFVHVCQGEDFEAIRYAIKALENTREKGEWIETSETWEEPGGYRMGYDWGYYYSCSVCGNKVRNKTCFCNRCGADMRDNKD